MLHSESHVIESNIYSNEYAATEVSQYNEIAMFWENDDYGGEDLDLEIPEDDEIDFFEFLEDDKEWHKFDRTAEWGSPGAVSSPFLEHDS